MEQQSNLTGRIIAETERLLLREMRQDDLAALCAIMCDEETMQAAYESPFTPVEVQRWLNRHLDRYRTLGFGLWAVVCKETGQMIGQCGLTLQQWDDRDLPEIGYLFRRDCWHKGYATEAAMACKQFAFHTLGLDRVCSIIRDTHIASQRVALRCGMQAVDRAVKTFRNTEMTFLLFQAERNGRADGTDESCGGPLR